MLLHLHASQNIAVKPVNLLSTRANLVLRGDTYCKLALVQQMLFDTRAARGQGDAGFLWILRFRSRPHMEKKTNGEKNEFILYEGIFILYIFISSFISSVKDMYLVRVF